MTGEHGPADDPAAVRRRMLRRGFLRTGLVIYLIAGLVALGSLLLGYGWQWATIAAGLASMCIGLLTFRFMLKLNDPMAARAEADARSRGERAAADSSGDHEPTPSP